MSLFEIEYGKEIDDHDCVVRLNKAAMLWTKFRVEQSHGKKTTHWFFFNVGEYRHRFNEIDPSVKKGHMSKMRQTAEQRRQVDMMFDRGWHQELCNDLGHRNPTTGLMSLFYLDRCNPKIIDIYGFDWKKTPTFTDPTRAKDPSCHHDFEKERDYCLKRFLSKPNIFLKQ